MFLNQLISVTEGIARAIQCLEAQSCNPADVYLLWLAVTSHIRATLRTSMIPESVCNEIRGIINHRWNEFFVENPGHEAYLAAFYLNPSVLISALINILLIHCPRVCKLVLFRTPQCCCTGDNHHSGDTDA
jgi:hypothetical protein